VLERYLAAPEPVDLARQTASTRFIPGHRHRRPDGRRQQLPRAGGPDRGRQRLCDYPSTQLGCAPPGRPSPLSIGTIGPLRCATQVSSGCSVTGEKEGAYEDEREFSAVE